ncbi:hypothetical protein D3C84_701610 [compost metagenome]
MAQCGILGLASQVIEGRLQRVCMAPVTGPQGDPDLFGEHQGDAMVSAEAPKIRLLDDQIVQSRLRAFLQALQPCMGQRGAVHVFRGGEMQHVQAVG